MIYFRSVEAALAMDGHGAYVWGAYGLTLLVIVVLLAVPLRRSRTARRRVMAELSRQTSADTEQTVENDAPKT